MESQRNKKAIDIIGIPMDLGANRRGVDMGPSALRIAGLSKKLAALGYRVEDLGDIHTEIIETQEVTDPKLKYVDEIVRAAAVLAETVLSTLNRERFPLCIGGDHSMAVGSIAGTSKYCRENGLTLGVIWLDAHSDMNTDKTTPSGNIHGMPLAAALGLGNERLTHVSGFSPKVLPENCALLGIRRIDRLEKETIKKLHLPVYTMTDIDRRGAYPVITEVLEVLLKRVDHIHVSLDLDCVDPSVAVGVGTPVQGGLSYREAHLIMETIAESKRMSSLEVAEVNPILDNQNQAAGFAADLVASSLGKRIL